MKQRRESYQKGTIVRVSRAKGPDVWVFRYYKYDLNGTPQRVAEQFSDTVECPTKAHAERKIAERRTEINEERACVFFKDLADKYEKEDLPARPHTRKTYLSNLKHLRDRWNKVRLDAMTSNIMEIQLWLNNLKNADGDPYSRQTRQHVRNLLHRMFEDAMLWGLIGLQRNPIDLIEIRSGARPKRRLLVLTAKQIDALLKDGKLSAHVKMMVRVAACTGMRISEVLGLKWEDVNFIRSTISIRRSSIGKHTGETKSEDSQVDSYPMHPTLSNALAEWKKESKPLNGWVFESIQTGRPFHASTLRMDHLQPAGERAGIVGLGWHTFRHTYRAMMADLEEPLEVQQALMRHSDIAMTMEYGKYTAGRAAKLREANAKVVELVTATGLELDSRRSA